MTVRNAIFAFLISITAVALPLQMAIEPTVTNSASACIVTASSLTVLLYI